MGSTRALSRLSAVHVVRNRAGAPFAGTRGLVVLDGSVGEGGGQTVRTALTLSAVTGKPFRIEQIRANRVVGGLGEQHLTCVRAAEQICSANTRGAQVGSKTLEFHPRDPITGQYEFSVSTAGSAVLVCQTVLPALMCLDGPSLLTFRGGTHNPMAPTFDFLQNSYLPMLRLLGPECQALLQRPGFFPAGGGRFHVRLKPTPKEKLKFLELVDRGRVLRKEVVCLFAGHGFRYAQDQVRELTESMDWREVGVYLDEWESDSPGMVLNASIVSENVTECFTSLAKPRKVHMSSQLVPLCKRIREYLSSDALVSEYLADQMLLPMALGRGGEFTCTEITPHLRTQMYVIEKFLTVEFATEKLEDKTAWSVLISV
ncbi:hypothetical protein NDN08_007278 [Rhodosorus marinus]|uniref:RNA 3'-terminal-phosphate cyclase (ATP) n=1 Tax=Rhodosorus marinus TaxID=101924 RepID=A0AAV8UJS4_9RHOD|nr:hypothetical protein NDN08_007278 [Rhodosorus marinus]